MARNLFTRIIFLLCFFSFNLANAQLDILRNNSKNLKNILKVNTLSKSEVSLALTEALNIAIDKSCSYAGTKNSFYSYEKIRIPFPKEIRHVKSALLRLGLENTVLNFEKKINLTAEYVSLQASEIILESVSNLNIKDAVNILNGEDNAATNYLRENSSEKLYASFLPIVKSEMLNTRAQKGLDVIISKYNKIPFAKNVKFNLSHYITLKTIDGLFVLIAEQEKEIRTNKTARTSDLLIKIFK